MAAAGLWRRRGLGCCGALAAAGRGKRRGGGALAAAGPP